MRIHQIRELYLVSTYSDCNNTLHPMGVFRYVVFFQVYQYEIMQGVLGEMVETPSTTEENV